MGWLSRLLHRLPLRLTAFALGLLVLIPAVLLANLFFPNLDRETIAVIFAFAMAGYLAFHVFGRHH